MTMSRPDEKSWLQKIKKHGKGNFKEKNDNSYTRVA
jgi:hypothetical protein